MLTLLRWSWIVASVLGLHIASAAAQGYPEKPIRFIVGAGPDVLARLVGERLTERWKQPVLVDQRPAAGGLIAADSVAKAPPDGYTLLLSTAADTINETLFAKTKQYDLVRDLAPVTFLASVPFFLVVPTSVQAGSVAELVQFARMNPGKLNYASPGSGTPPHLAGEIMKSMAGISIVHIAYKTVPQAVSDLLSGQVQVLFAVSPVGLPHVKAGRLKALAVSSLKRSLAAPDIPTMDEVGFPGFDVIGWYGVMVPAGTPGPIVAKLHAEITRALKVPEVQERMRSFGMEPVGTSPEEFVTIVKSDIAKWAKVIKNSNILAN